MSENMWRIRLCVHTEFGHELELALQDIQGFAAPEILQHTFSGDDDEVVLELWVEKSPGQPEFVLDMIRHELKRFPEITELPTEEVSPCQDTHA